MRGRGGLGLFSHHPVWMLLHHHPSIRLWPWQMVKRKSMNHMYCYPAPCDTSISWPLHVCDRTCHVWSCSLFFLDRILQMRQKQHVLHVVKRGKSPCCTFLGKGRNNTCNMTTFEVNSINVLCENPSSTYHIFYLPSYLPQAS